MSCARSSATSPAAALLARQAVNYIVRVAGETAKLGRVWPHMLRHSCGYYLTDQGTDLRTMQDYLGHRDPKRTAHDSRVAGHQFEGLGK
jgi:type 1 fimbriae regulatory protein FimB